MKKLILIVTMFVGSANAFAQDEDVLAFKEGDNVFSVGYGFPNVGATFLKVANRKNNYTTSGFGPFSIKYERAIAPSVGVGISYNYANYSATWSDSGFNYKAGRKTNSFLIRMNVHFGTTDKIDPYFGVGAGFRNAVYYFESDDKNFSKNSFNLGQFFPVGFETTLGLRYYITPNVGMYMELGLAKALIQGGLAIKI